MVILKRSHGNSQTVKWYMYSVVGAVVTETNWSCSLPQSATVAVVWCPHLSGLGLIDAQSN